MKALIAVIMTIGILFSMAGTASADYGYRECNITGIDVGSDGVIGITLFRIDNETTHERDIHADLETRGLATVLTAVALGFIVDVNFNPGEVTEPILNLKLIIP